MPAWTLLLGHPTLQRHASHKRHLAMPWLSPPWINMLCCWEHWAPSILRVMSSSGIYNEMSHSPGWGVITQSPLTSFSCCYPHLLNRTHYSVSDYWNGICAFEEGERGEFCPRISAPAHLFLAMLPPLPNKYSMYSQVKLLKLPTSLYSRPDRHILFFSGTIIWPLSLFSPLA